VRLALAAAALLVSAGANLKHKKTDFKRTHRQSATGTCINNIELVLP